MADISRAEVSTLIEEEYAHDLLLASQNNSAALRAFRRVDMGTKTTNLPVLATLPSAAFVAESATDEGGVKPTAEVTWGNKQLVAEEIAVIIPVHENVIEDATTDIVAQIVTEGGAAIGRALDAAVLFGTNKPASWTSSDLRAAAIAASQFTTVSTGTNDLAGAFLQSAEDVDTAGWEPTTLIAPKGLRYRLANLRASGYEPIFMPSLSSVPGAVDNIAGLDAVWAAGVIWNRSTTEGFVIDRSRVVLGVRQDISVKFLDQATVGSINLAERDMVALRFKARYAYVLGSGTNSEGTGKVPVAAVLPAVGS